MSSASTESNLTAEAVTRALSAVPYPGLKKDLVSFGMVDHVSVCGTLVKVRLALRVRDETLPAKIRASITDALAPLGASEVAVEIAPPVAAPVPHTARATTDPWSD